MIGELTKVQINGEIVPAQVAYATTYEEFPTVLMYDRGKGKLVTPQVEQAVNYPTFQMPAVEILTELGVAVIVSPSKVFLSHSRIGEILPMAPREIDVGKKYFVWGIRSGHNLPQRISVIRMIKRHDVVTSYWVKPNDPSLLLWASGILVQER